MSDPQKAIEAWQAREKQLLARIAELSAKVDALRAEVTDRREALAAMTAKRDALKAEVARWRAAFKDTPKVEPDPPIVVDPPNGGEPWTFAYAGKSVHAVKEARPPGWRGDPSPPRTEVVGYQDAELGEAIEWNDVRMSLRPGHHAKSVLSNSTTAPDGDVRASLTLSNVELGDSWVGLYWFARLYHLGESLITRCDAQGTWSGAGDRPRPKEHFVYGGFAASTVFRENHVTGMGGKAWYMAHRPFPHGKLQEDGQPQYSPDTAHYEESPLHVVYKNVIVDCEQDASRGSYSITLYDAGSYDHPGEVLIEGNVIAAQWDRERPQGSNDWSEPDAAGDAERRVRACGAIKVVSQAFYGDETAWPVERVTLRENLIHMGQANHPIAGLHNVKHVVIEGNVVESTGHRQPVIEIGRSGFAPGQKAPETVIVRNNYDTTGATTVRVTEDDGTTVSHLLHTPDASVRYTRESGRFEEFGG